MRCGLFALAGLLVAGFPFALPATAETLSTDAAGCGGDAYSSAQVIEGRPARRGPITAMPDTLCADLSAPRDSTRIEIYGVPGLSGGGYGGDSIGANGGTAPYDARPLRRPRRGD